MTRRKLFLLVQSALCVLLGAMLIAAVVGLYREGVAQRAAGDASRWIFTREAVSLRLRAIAPVFAATAATAVVGIALGMRDERPARSAGTDPDRLRASARRPERKIAAARTALLAVAAALITMGIANGSMRDVLAKAVKICTECVGLG